MKLENMLWMLVVILLLAGSVKIDGVTPAPPGPPIPPAPAVIVPLDLKPAVAFMADKQQASAEVSKFYAQFATLLPAHDEIDTVAEFSVAHKAALVSMVTSANWPAGTPVGLGTYIDAYLAHSLGFESAAKVPDNAPLGADAKAKLVEALKTISAVLQPGAELQ